TDFTPPAILRLLDPQMIPGNGFKFRATATERAAYVVEHSANLVAWTPLLTNSLSPLEITHSSSNAEFRAYRMRETPCLHVDIDRVPVTRLQGPLDNGRRIPVLCPTRVNGSAPRPGRFTAHGRRGTPG